MFSENPKRMMKRKKKEEKKMPKHNHMNWLGYVYTYKNTFRIKSKCLWDIFCPQTILRFLSASVPPSPSPSTSSLQQPVPISVNIANAKETKR